MAMAMANEQRWVAGVDEVGRGPLAGPVVAAAVILNPNEPVAGLKDSKLLSPKRRMRIAQQIRITSLSWGIGRADVAEIDRINILQATLLAMRRAVLALDSTPTRVLVDGNRCPLLPFHTEAIIGGDAIIDAISAASILAKVVRDEEMVALDARYPKYGFTRHKGYATREHLDRLRRYGVCPIHRRTFRPMCDMLGNRSQGQLDFGGRPATPV